MVRRAALACVLLAAGTAGVPRAGASSWSETRYGTRDGLPSPYVKCAAEDGAGFVWLATDGGLVRFDGSTFTPYLDAPSGRFVKAVAALRDGRVLVAGDSGVSVVSATARGARIEQLVPAGERAGDSALHYPKGLFVDSQGRAWVSEPESVALLQGGSRFERFTFPAEARSTSFVRSFSLAEDDRGRIWAAARSGELFALDEASRRFVPAPLPAGSPARGDTNHLAAVGHDLLWLASDAGLVELRLAADRAAVLSARALGGFAAPSWIQKVGADVLVTSYAGPALRVRPGHEAGATTLSAASLIQHAFPTRSGDLYLSTDDGLLVLQRRPFEALPLPAGELALNVQSFALGPRGVLYACDRRNVYRLERDGASVRTVRELALPGPMLMGLLGDATRLAVAGLGRLLLVDGGRITRALDLSDRGTYVVGLAATRDGSVWIAQFDSRGALRLLPDGTLKAYGAESGLRERVVALRVGADGALYATGAGRASYLFRYDPARDAFANLSRPASFEPPEPFDVLDVEVDRAGRFWLASTAGLLEQDESLVRRADLGPELTGLPTHSLTTTRDGRLWIATSAGLVGLQPERGAYETYDESSGLPSKNLGFHGLFSNGDELLVATTRGIARALVSELVTPPASPPVIVQLRADGNELDLGGPGVLPVPHAAWISAHAASPGGGERVYQWRMEPADAGWRLPSTRPEAVLPTRGSGEHRLLVRAAVRGSNAWGAPAQLRLRVAAAWYERWWALLGFAAVFAGVFAGGLLLARRTAQRNERRLEQLVEERTGALQQANAQLGASNAELERFAYTVSHDLKSPLVTIRGFLGFLEPAARAGDLDRLQGDVARIGQAAERMALLLDQLLELSRVGRTRNPPVRVPFAEIAREAARLADGPLRARGVSLEIADELPLVEGDRLRLVELVQNLLENAAKFSGEKPHPRVLVGARPSPSGPVLFVRDEGIGVEASQHERIFGLFQKLDPKSGGTGLGLAIARRIAETHGGRLWIESEGRGRGSTFCFTLPCPGGGEAG